MGSIRAWQPAQAGFARCCVIASRIVSILPGSAPSVFSAGTSGGGGGGGEDSRFSRNHLPRSTGDVRVAYEVTARILPCPNRPPRGLSSGNVTHRNQLP